MKMYHLTPNDSHKSFYGKARVYVRDDGAELLVSYDTPVMLHEDGQYYRLWGGYSATTMRHVRAFAGNEYNKKRWMDMPVYSY